MENKNDKGSVSQKNVSAADLLSKLNANIDKNPSKGIKYSTAQPPKLDLRIYGDDAADDIDSGKAVSGNTGSHGAPESVPKPREAGKTAPLAPNARTGAAAVRPTDEIKTQPTQNEDYRTAEPEKTYPDEPSGQYPGSAYRFRVENRKKSGSLLPPPAPAEKTKPGAVPGGETPPQINSTGEIPRQTLDRYDGFGVRPNKNSRADLQKRIEDAEKYISGKQTQKDIVVIKETSSPEDSGGQNFAQAETSTLDKVIAHQPHIEREDMASASSDARRSAAGKSKSAKPDKDTANDGDFDETDMNLMIAFGMEDELERRVGADKASEIEQNIDKSSGGIEEKLIKTGELSEKKEAFEFTAVSQVKEIFRGYKAQYTGLLWRIITCAILLIISFFYENIEIFRGSLPSMIDAKSYPVVHVLIGLQLLTLAGALIYKPLIAGLNAIVKLKPTPESAIAIMMALSLVYHVALCFMGIYSGVRLYNFPMILAVLLTLLYEFNNLRREIYAFNIVSSKKDKYTVDKIESDEASLERDAFEEYLGESPLMFRIGRVKFVDGFYRRMRAPASEKRAISVIIPVVVAAAAAVFGVAIVLKQGFYNATLLSYITLVIGMPFSLFITYSYPFFIASREAFESESAIIGESSLEEYAKASVISFDDSDVFPANGVKLKTVKVFGDNRIDLLINDVRSVFSKLNGPLSEVFEIATLDMKMNSDKVEILEIADDGIEAMLGDRRILVGKGECLRRHDFEPVNAREDDEIENGGETTVMYMVINHEVVAKMYIQYIIDPDFEFTLKQLYKSGMCVGIKTLDPNINDTMLSTRVKISKYAVKVLKYHEPFAQPTHDGRADSGVITKGSPKTLLQTLALCDKVLHIIKTNNVVKIFAIIISMIIIAFLLMLNLAPSVLSIYVALYQIFWIIPMVIISRLFI